MAQGQILDPCRQRAEGTDDEPNRPAPGVSTALGAVPRAYFEEAAAVGRAVFARGDLHRSFYAFGRLTCCIRYADRGTQAALHRALSHLEIPSRPSSDLTIHAWDTTETQHRLPEPHEIMLLYYRNHCLALCSDSRYLALDERWLGAKSFIDRERGEAWYAVSGIGALPLYQRAAPLRSVLNALFASRGGHLVHAAALGTERAGVLMPGAAGAGKSSTALTCLGGTLRYLADDWCGIWDGDPPRIFSVYNSAKLRTDNLERFPELRAGIAGHDDTDEEKATLFLAEHCPSRLLDTCPARAILLPHVCGTQHTAIEPAPRKQAWQTLLTWTLSQIPGCKPNSAAALMTRICARLPVYRLELGTDRDELRTSLERFVTNL